MVDPEGTRLGFLAESFTLNIRISSDTDNMVTFARSGACSGKQRAFDERGHAISENGHGDEQEAGS